ncbi:hypothetical protein DYB25_010114 [Aphanomyces astaci]|uniref:Protein kinase domain-containing protein n=1 Tax=Aphanomyces astaci TaxID=112090 RepID=A0A397B8K7_APHAT|nr:hypothetical protein DYB25_010114 [Aphanomyces astaci]
MLTTSGTPASRGSSHDLLAKLTKRREEVEREEMARALMFEEDERSHEEVERAKVAMETPLILEQDAAHREFVRLLQKCLDPSIMLKRLNFERVLAVRSPTDNMVLRMVDSATNMHCIVHTIRCASVDEADNVVMLARQLHHHRPPHTVEVLHVFQYMYQQFATHGNLNECWPVVFVVTEDCMEGGSVYAIDDAAGERRQQLKLGGVLAFKQPFTQDDLSKLPSIVHPSLVPPELTSTSRYTSRMMLNEKTDMWMLGCLLYSLVTGSEQVVREKSLSTIMTDIPLRYGTSIRSCLRMLLQPLPQHRPTAMEIFNFISCASPDEGVAADTKASSFSMTLKKSVRSLHPLPCRLSWGESKTQIIFMSSSSLMTADIHATSAAATTQPCLHGDPIRGGMPEAVPASTSIASEQVPWRANATATAVKTLLEILRPFSDYVQPFVAIFVLAMSTQVILGVYVLGAACMVILDHRFRGFIAAETSRASLLCITLMCAKTSVDVATSNGDATPLHTLFKPFADPTTLADMVWTVLIKCTS